MNSTREKRIGENIVHSNVVLENESDYAERSALPRDVIMFPGDNSIIPNVRDFNYGSPCPPRCDNLDNGE
jgi:hypothetical protein